MLISDYLIKKIKRCGTTDIFGIPGGVILPFIKAINKSNSIDAHLNYHEQMAGFAACGYAQSSGKLGVAYATRGPGITNMITCIAEAYQESLPVLFITGHGNRGNGNLRFENNQELDVALMVSGITKYAVSVETVNEAIEAIDTAIDTALSGRKGPVFLDFSSQLWNRNTDDYRDRISQERVAVFDFSDIISEIENSKRPVLLIGDGVRHCLPQIELERIADRLSIPVLSSRGSQDILSGSKYYHGYIGSHGIRYSNFILSKSDLIISVGNRLAFPVTSESFAPVFKNAKLIRIDIDSGEFNREIPFAKNIEMDAKTFFDGISRCMDVPKEKKGWISVCNEIREQLQICDCTEPVKKISWLMEKDKTVCAYTCDVGNNEFWASRAYELVRPKAGIYFSKAFGTLGVALGRSIGVYYATGQPVTCIIGDQGFQYNIQELQFISKWKLPIKIVVINNRVSGMIRDHEMRLGYDGLFHVEETNGYYPSDIYSISQAYNIEYTNSIEEASKVSLKPLVCEISIDSKSELTPNLPKGNPCQNLYPLLDKELYEQINLL